MTIVILAEKPAVARDIAAVLGANDRRRGWIEGNGYQVTWAVGHLVSLAQPHEIREEWRRWDPAHHHAIIPTATPADLAPSSDASKLYELVCRRLLAAWQPDAIDATTKVDVTIVSPGMEDRYQARGEKSARPCPVVSPSQRAAQIFQDRGHTLRKRDSGAVLMPFFRPTRPFCCPVRTGCAMHPPRTCARMSNHVRKQPAT